jgi:hypothetical protein
MPSQLDRHPFHSPFFAPNRFIVYEKHEMDTVLRCERKTRTILRTIEFAIVPLHVDWVDETRRSVDCVRSRQERCTILRLYCSSSKVIT